MVPNAKSQDALVNAIFIEEKIKLGLGRKAMCQTSMNFLLHRNILQNPSNALLLVLLLPLLRPHNIRSSPSSPCGYSLIHPMFILLDKEGAGKQQEASAISETLGFHGNENFGQGFCLYNFPLQHLVIICSVDGLHGLVRRLRRG